MSFDALETSQLAGEPVELYRWARGATVWRQTSADQRFSVDVGGDGNQDYDPAPIRRTAPSYRAEDSSGTISVSVSRFNPVGQQFIGSAPPAPVSVTIYRMHRTDPEVIVAFVGKVVAASCDGSWIRLQCAPLTVALRRNIPRILQQRQCVWALYGAGCGVNRATFQDTATVLAVSGLDVQAAEFALRADGWFSEGWLEKNDGDKRAIVGHVGDTVTLDSPFISLAAAETVYAFAGCLRTEAVCTAKFSNLINFMGFERIPSKDPYRLGMA